MTPDPRSIRTFRASSLPEALAQVKRALGPDALILGTRQIERRGIAALAGPVVEITAARAAGEGTEAASSVASDLRVRRGAERGGQPPSAGNAERGGQPPSAGNAERGGQPPSAGDAKPVGLRSKDTTGTILSDSAMARRRTAGGGCPPPAREQGTGNRKQVASADIAPPVASDLRVRRAFDIPHSTFDIPAGRDPLRRWYERLVQRELGEHLARIVVEHVRRRVGTGATPDDIDAAVRAELTRLMPAADGIELRPDGPTRVALVGPPGSGKTTTLAKIAAHFRLREKKRVAIVSLDAHRLGTAEQLERYGRIIGAAVRTIRTPEEAEEIFATGTKARRHEGTEGGEQGTGNGEQDSPARAGSPRAAETARRGAFDIPHSTFVIRREAAPHFALRSSDFDLVLIDTPGVSPNDVELRSELAELLRAAEPHEVHLVLPASLRPDVQRRTIEAFALFGVRRVVLSRLDEASGFGVVLEMLRQLDWAVSYLTTGQKVPTDLKRACGPDLAALLLSTEAVGA